MRDSFVFYKSFAEGIRCLPEDQQLEAFWNIIDYALDGTEPDGDGAAKAIFNMAKPQIDTNNKRYQNGCKGGRPKNQTETKTKPNQNQTKTKPKPNVNVNDNENVNVNDNANENEKNNTPHNPPKGKRFKPPTANEVRAYCIDGGYNIDPDAFVDFYEAKGWMVGKNKMKDWKAAVRNWARSENKKPRQEKAADVFDEWRKA